MRDWLSDERVDTAVAILPAAEPCGRGADVDAIFSLSCSLSGATDGGKGKQLGRGGGNQIGLARAIARVLHEMRPGAPHSFIDWTRVVSLARKKDSPYHHVAA